MARTTIIDKKIAELQDEINVREHAISVLKGVQKKKFDPTAKAAKTAEVALPYDRKATSIDDRPSPAPRTGDDRPSPAARAGDGG